MAEQHNDLSKVIASVAAEENGAADIIRAEAIKLQQAINKGATPAQLLAVNDSIGRMMDELTQNNAELAKKMDIATSTPNDPNDPPTSADQTARKDAKNDVIESIANEESAMADLMHAEAEKIKAVANNQNSTVDDMIKINDSASGIVDKIKTTNQALEKKLESAVKA